MNILMTRYHCTRCKVSFDISYILDGQMEYKPLNGTWDCPKCYRRDTLLIHRKKPDFMDADAEGVLVVMDEVPV